MCFTEYFELPRSSISTKASTNQSSGRPEDHYDRIAAAYDVERFGCRCGEILNETELGIVRGLLQRGGLTLDVGAGSGRFSLMAAELSDEVVALDASPRMISVAAAKKDRGPIGHSISFLLGDVDSLPFRDAAFDNVIAIRLFSHFADLDRPASEMARVLKHGGRLIVDLPNRLARTYSRFDMNPTISSYCDYFHPLPEIKSALEKRSIQLSRRITYGAVPISLLHRALCGHRKLVPPGLLKLLIGSGRGLSSFAEGVRYK